MLVQTRNLIFNFVLEWKEKYAEVRFEEQEMNSEIYKPTYLPEGFREKSTRIFGDITMIIYSNDAGVELILNQRPIKSGTSLIDNEYTTFIEVNVSGNTGYLFKSNTEDDPNVLIWSSNGAVFELTSKIESEQLLLIAESIKK